MFVYGTLTKSETLYALQQIQGFNVNEDLFRKLCTSNLNNDVLRESLQLVQYIEILSDHKQFGAIADFAHRRWVSSNSPINIQQPKDYTKPRKIRKTSQPFIRANSPLTGAPKLLLPRYIRQKPVEASWRVTVLRKSVDNFKTLQRNGESKEIEKQRQMQLTVRFRFLSFMNDLARAISTMLMFQRIRRFILQLID